MEYGIRRLAFGDTKEDRHSSNAWRVPRRYTLGRGIEEEVSSDNIYSAQPTFCREPGCDTVDEHMGDVGLCKYHALVKTFRDYFEETPYEAKLRETVDCTNVNVFGTLTFAPRSVSPTNLNFRFEDTGNGHLNDPAVGIQRGTKDYEEWEMSIRTTFNNRLRRLAAVTEYGSNNNTGRLHIHYVMRVLCLPTVGEVSKLLWNIRNTRLSERWRHGFSTHEVIKNPEATLNYITKYIGKDQDDDRTRFWTLPESDIAQLVMNIDNRL